MKEAAYYKKLDDKASCLLCPHRCVIREGEKGVCGVRQNTGGTLYSINYGKVSAMHIDPIEKKPLYRFMPGTYTFSIGSFGCNLACPFCQNYDISKGNPRTIEYTPENIVSAALQKDTPSISYTYSEPVVFYEFMLDTAKAAKKKGLKNIMVTNGYINKEPLLEALTYMDAMNIDLKAFDENVYRKTLKGSLAPVLETIKEADKKCHVEVTMLIVPKLNDDLLKIKQAAKTLAAINKGIPFHISRYFPRYKYGEPATDTGFLQTAYSECKKYLSYVYLGNV